MKNSWSNYHQMYTQKICTEKKLTGPGRSKPADRTEHVRLPWLVYPAYWYLWKSKQNSSFCLWLYFLPKIITAKKLYVVWPTILRILMWISQKLSVHLSETTSELVIILNNNNNGIFSLNWLLGHFSWNVFDSVWYSVGPAPWQEAIKYIPLNLRSHTWFIYYLLY